ncbi:hypothetical protein [Streptomyces sp. NPDC051219]|uniref:hypothetical protein n=1 Tax=Streptomyces sp. NPDC051219 TaxID=3155283 RepID=UPI0034281C12
MPFRTGRVTLQSELPVTPPRKDVMHPLMAALADPDRVRLVMAGLLRRTRDGSRYRRPA